MTSLDRVMRIHILSLAFLLTLAAVAVPVHAGPAACEGQVDKDRAWPGPHGTITCVLFLDLGTVAVPVHAGPAACEGPVDKDRAWPGPNGTITCVLFLDLGAHGEVCYGSSLRL